MGGRKHGEQNLNLQSLKAAFLTRFLRNVQIENLDRKVQLRVQIQKPFQFCDGHDVLGAAAPSFGENIKRMVRSALAPGTQPMLE
jgi:hypothetical protein